LSRCPTLRRRARPPSASTIAPAIWTGASTDLDGRVHRLRRQGFPTLAAAIRWTEARASEVKLGIVRPPRRQRTDEAAPARPTVDQVFELLVDYWTGRLKPATVYTYRVKYKNHIRPVCGARVFAELDQRTLNTLAACRNPGAASIFKVMLRDAPRVGLKAPEGMYNPPAHKRNPRIVFLEPSEAQAVRELLPAQLRPLFTILVTTGLRSAELFGLSFLDVDRRRSLLYVKRNFVYAPGPTFNSPKNGKSRCVPLARATMAALEELSMHLHGRSWPEPPADAEPTDWLVARFCMSYFRQCLTEAGRAAGLHKPCSPHVLRHTAASWLVQSGTPLEVIAEILGHFDLSVTKAYSHLKPGHLTSSVERLSSLLNP